MDHRSRLPLRIVVLAACAAAVAGCGGPDTVRTVFTVEGMYCDGCSSTITATLERVEGVLEASADHEEGIATAVFNPGTVSVEELELAIEELGYTVTGTSTEALEG